MNRTSVMNNTKWEELRLAMYGLGAMCPRWRTLDHENGNQSSWDREWYYHFKSGGYESIEWVEIAYDSGEQRDLIHQRLQEIHVPGTESEGSFTVYGYVPIGQPIEYL